LVSHTLSGTLSNTSFLFTGAVVRMTGPSEDTFSLKTTFKSAKSDG